MTTEVVVVYAVVYGLAVALTIENWVAWKRRT